VPNGNYKVETIDQGNSVTIQIVLEKKRRQLSRGSMLPGTKEAEKFADRKGAFCYTVVLVYIPIRGVSLEEHCDYDLMIEIVGTKYYWGREIAIKAINRFISIYRYCTGECHIQPLTGHDVWFDFSATFLFNENPPTANKSKFKGAVTPHFNIQDVIPSVPDIPEIALQEIRNRLKTSDKIPLSDELMLNAYDLLDQGNYRLAIIESETAFEAFILAFLRQDYQDQPDILVEIETIKSFGQLLNCQAFKQAISRRGKSFGKEERYRQEWYKNVWSLRGGLVHGRIDDVSYKEASDAIETIEKTLDDVRKSRISTALQGVK
jgi:hypothetical protein